MATDYSDTQHMEKELCDFLKAQKEVGSHIDLWPSRYYNFSFRYHLSALRANLLRYFNFDGLSVLELGAGMGGVSRFLAESCESLHVVEGSKPRYQVVKERLKDLANWTGTIANIEDFSTSKKFDAVCLVGILENPTQFIQSRNQLSPFDVAMKTAKKHLKPGGAIIIANENKLGIKYWNGAAESHTERMFDSITGYDPDPKTKTVNRQELLDLFKNNGFTNIEEFYPFPDYKFPTAILHSNAFELPAEVIAEMACRNEFESYGTIRQPLFPDYLTVLEVARAGIIQDMANSFLYVGFKGQDNDIKKVLLTNLLVNRQKAWFFSKRSKGQILSKFIQEKKGWRVVKQILIPWQSEPVSYWHPVNEELVHGTSLRELLERAAYHHQWQTMTDELSTFLQWLLSGKHYRKGETLLADPVWTNARKTDDGYQLFDQEWRIPLHDNPHTDFMGWVVFRNILVLNCINYYWSKTRPWKTLKELYEQMTEILGMPNSYEQQLQTEALFQSQTSGNTPVAELQQQIDKVMTRKRWRQSFITNPQDWTTLTRYCSVYLSKLRFLHGLELRLRKWLGR